MKPCASGAIERRRRAEGLIRRPHVAAAVRRRAISAGVCPRFTPWHSYTPRPWLPPRRGLYRPAQPPRMPRKALPCLQWFHVKRVLVRALCQREAFHCGTPQYGGVPPQILCAAELPAYEPICYRHSHP